MIRPRVIAFLALLALLDGTRGSDAEQRTPIARTGATTVALERTRTPVTAVIRTKLVGGESPCTAPGMREAREASVISDIAITSGQAQLFVPASVFADLVDPSEVSLSTDGRGTVLTIRGGDGAEGYLVRVYFDDKSVRRRTLASLLMPDKPTQDTRYTLRVLKDR